jgi:hypothetical protein
VLIHKSICTLCQLCSPFYTAKSISNFIRHIIYSIWTFDNILPYRIGIQTVAQKLSTNLVHSSMPPANRGVLLSTFLHGILHPSHHLLNVLLQIAHKLGLSNKKKKNIKMTTHHKLLAIQNKLFFDIFQLAYYSNISVRRTLKRYSHNTYINGSPSTENNLMGVKNYTELKDAVLYL